MQAGRRQKELRGRRVLVVEDEVLVALDYCQNLQEAGAEVVGPFHTVDDALNCMGKGRIDVAVLDYALADRTVCRCDRMPTRARPAQRQPEGFIETDFAQHIVPERSRRLPLRQNSSGVKGLFWPAFCVGRS